MFEIIKKKIKFLFKEYPKYSPEERKDYKAYKKNLLTTKRKLIKASKKFRPWDYGFLIELMKPVIDSWLSYYEVDYNVWAVEEENAPSRLEVAKQLKEIISKYESEDNADCLNDEELLRELFIYLSQFITLLWD